MDNKRRDKEFIGQGLAFPLQVDPQGGIALARGHHDIDQAIKLILETSPGERVMRPEFGCRIHELIFAERNAATEGLMIHYVEQALERWEPRIEVRDIEIIDHEIQQGAIVLTIHYAIKATHDERSLVYPLFLMGEEE